MSAHPLQLTAEICQFEGLQMMFFLVAFNLG